MACFRNPAFDNTHNLTAPTDDRGELWNVTGLLHDRFVVVALGPRLVCTARHLGGITIGSTTIAIQGVTRVITAIIESPTSTDVQYLTLDADIPGAWARRWNNETFSATSNILAIHGKGLGRGDPIFVGPTLVGWLEGPEPTRARRWSQGKLAYLEPQPTLTRFGSRFEDPGSESAFGFNGDSGSGCFIDVGPGSGVNKWLYIGPMVSASSSTEARFDTLQYGILGATILLDKDLIDGLIGLPSITITDPMDGFDLSGDVLPVIGNATGLSQITIRINGELYRVNVSGGMFTKTVDIPESTEPIEVTIDAFDATTEGASTVFSNVVHGEAVNIPPPEPPEPPDVDPTYWTEEGYETFLQSEISLYDSDNEKTVRNFSLDFTHGEEVPLLCHSQIGVGGLPNCIDWWDSEPWPLDCQLYGERLPGTRDTGPMSWPYYATGRYIGWRIFVSTGSNPLSYEPKGGVIDFTRVSLTLSLKSSCL